MIRIAVQLLDTHTGRQLWADRHDVTAGTLFTVQDQIAEQIASAQWRVDDARQVPHTV